MTPPEPFSDASQVETIGSDRLIRKGDTLVIYSAVIMPDWRVTDHRKSIVVCRGRQYHIAAVRPVGRRRWRYVLIPCTVSPLEVPGQVIHYDEQYVEDRDRARGAGRHSPLASPGLFLARPLAGFLPARMKARLEEKYGIDPLQATRESLTVQFLLLLPAAFIGAMYAYLNQFHLFISDMLFLAGMFLFVDAVIRFVKLQELSNPPYGLGEWLAVFVQGLGREHGAPGVGEYRFAEAEEVPPAGPGPGLPREETAPAGPGGEAAGEGAPPGAHAPGWPGPAAEPGDPAPPDVPAPAGPAPSLVADFTADQVFSRGDTLFVASAREMPDWRVSAFRKTAVVFADRLYFVAAVEADRDGRWLYTLRPWAPADPDPPGRVIEYDLEYVRTREASVSAACRQGAASGLIRFLAPLAGFLPARLKKRLEDRFDLDSRKATRYSLFLEWGLILAFSSWMAASALGKSILGGRDPGLQAVLVLAPDAVVRTLWLIDGSRLYGFYEWLARVFTHKG